MTVKVGNVYSVATTGIYVVTYVNGDNTLVINARTKHESSRTVSHILKAWTQIGKLYEQN